MHHLGENIEFQTQFASLFLFFSQIAARSFKLAHYNLQFSTLNKQMKDERIRKAIVIGVALIGAALNGYYGIQLFKAFLAPQTDFAVRQILVSAIVLEFGWMALLIWVVFKTFEKRDILLFT